MQIISRITNGPGINTTKQIVTISHVLIGLEYSPIKAIRESSILKDTGYYLNKGCPMYHD
jgi:hypothetical protein